MVARTEVNLGIFFFQAEDGIRDDLVTGVQTCALPICIKSGGAAATRTGQYKKWGAAATRNGQFKKRGAAATRNWQYKKRGAAATRNEIGRASCRERV